MRYPILALLTAAALAGAARAGEGQQARLEAIRGRIGAVQEQIEQDQHQRQDVSKKLAAVEREIAALGARLQALDQAIATRREALSQLQAEGQKMAGQLQGRLASLAQRMDAAYRLGRQGRLQLVLAQDDPTAIGRLLGYYEYYARAQSRAIAKLREDLAGLAVNRRAAAAERQRLDRKRGQRAATLAALRSSQKERHQTLATIDTRLRGEAEELADLQADEAELEALIETLRTRLADLPPAGPTPAFAKLKGQLVPPVNGPAIARFGQAKAGGRLQWQGVWLEAAAGSPVAAAAAGRVVYVGWMHRYGLVVVLDHGGDYYTVYGHNQSIRVELGDWVGAGGIIASAGTTGGHRSSGVYFEIRHGRAPLDPSAWLRG